MNNTSTQKHKSSISDHRTSDASSAATANATATLRLGSSAEKTTLVESETQESLLSGNDTPEDFVAIIDLDEDTKALVQEEFGQEEGGENLNALFGGATSSYGLAALSLGGAMQGIPSSNDGNARQAAVTNAGGEEPQASGDASPFGNLLAAFNNIGNNSPDAPTAPAQADGAMAPQASDNTNTSASSSNTLGDLLPLLEITASGVSSQAATPAAMPSMSQPPALF